MLNRNNRPDPYAVHGGSDLHGIRHRCQDIRHWQPRHHQSFHISQSSLYISHARYEEYSPDQSVQLLIVQVALLITSFSSLFQAVASLDRIQDFLLLEKRADFRSSGRRLTSGEKDKPVWDDESSGRSVMEVKGASFGWEKQGAAVLRDVNLSVHQSSLTLLVGPVASGKSSLLGGLLGETYLHSGSVWIEDVENVAYCDQDPWILNQSIRDNIIGFSEYEEGFYGTVIRACQLEEDFSQLPEGDMSLVGSQGISLSGGQKQRVVSCVDN